jgi:multidrug efflux pump subunit AcrA (membrane-fusion protein)
MLPDGSAAEASVSAVAAVPAADTGKDSTLAVTVTSDLDDALKSLVDGTTVRVTFTKTVAAKVLLVPVTALVALPDGGYGVQKAGADGTTSTVKVTPGRFSATMVEVADGDLVEGDKVVVTP